MGRYERQFAAAQAQHENAAPNDDGDLLDGEVDASCASSVSEFITGEMGDEFLPVDVTDVMADWITSNRDQYALAKFNREMYELAQRVATNIESHNEKVRADAEELSREMREFARDCARDAA